MSHEVSITIQDERSGRWVNIASVINGRQVSEEEAIDAYYKGINPPLGNKDFDTVEEAEGEAVIRSLSYGDN